MKIDPLLYRFGFVCVAESEPPSGGGELWETLRSGWKTARIGDLLVLAHPETPVTPVSGSAVLIGHAFAVGDDRSAGALLETALAAGSDAVLHETLDVLSGRFALITSRGRVYHDAVGSRTVFYHLGQPACIASHGGLVGELLGAAVDPLAGEISRQPEYTSRSVAYLPGDLSAHDGVRALVPNNYYDVSSGRTVRYWPRAPREKTTLDQFRSCADTYFDSFAAYLSGRFTPVLGVTPGIDSRTIIAAFRQRNLPMRYVTWKDVALPEQDLPVAEGMVSYLGGQHAFLPEEGQEEGEVFHRVGDLAGKNGGHFRGRSRLTAYMYQTFEGERDPVFVRGHGAEIVRGFPAYYRRPMIEGMSVADLVRAYESSARIKGQPSEKYLDLASEAVEQFMLRANYGGLDAFGYDLNDLYYWEHRMGMWGSSLHNEVDPAMSSMTGFNNRRLFETAFGLEPEERLTDGLLLDLTRRYDEGLAAFPINPSKRPNRSKAQRNADASPSKQAGISGRRREPDSAGSQVAQLTARLKVERRRKRNLVEAERKRSKALEKELEEKRAELGEARREHRKSLREQKRLRSLYLDIVQSRSWRYTLPLRRLIGALKRIARR